MSSELLVENISGMINKSEIDSQVATAKAYPRNIGEVIQDVTELVTQNEQIASDCLYCLKRGDTKIEGASTRFAEILVSCWGNARCGARVISEDDRFIVIQGAFQDVQKNVAVSVEIRRRITYKNGGKFNDDMVSVTSNAAASIAIRNAILKGIPKAIWDSAYQAARTKAIGDQTTIAVKRKQMIEYFNKIGVPEKTILEFCVVQSVSELTLDHIAQLKGIATRIKANEVTIEDAFLPGPEEGAPKQPTQTVKKKTLPSAENQFSPMFAHCKTAEAVEQTHKDITSQEPVENDADYQAAKAAALERVGK